MSKKGPERARAAQSIDALDDEKTKGRLAETFCASGSSALLEGDFDEAFDNFQRALKLDDRMIDARVGLGKVWLEFEEYERALRCADDALAIDADSPTANELRGHALRLLERNAEALESYARAIELDKRPYLAFYGRAISYDMLGESAKALRDFNSCLALAPEFVFAYYDRAVMLANEKKYAEAIVDYSKALELDEEFVHCYVARGEAFYETRDYQAAINDFNAALDLDPDNPDAYYYRSCAYRRLGNERAAKRDLQIAKELGFLEERDA